MGNQSNWFDFKREKRIVVAKKYVIFVTKNKKDIFDMHCYYDRLDGNKFDMQSLKNIKTNIIHHQIHLLA